MRFCAFVVLTLVSLAVPASADTLYSTGFRDPASHSDQGIVRWDGPDLATAPWGSTSFILTTDAIIDSVTFWAYDTVDGSGGFFEQVEYEFFADQLITDALGTMTEKIVLSGHRSPDIPGIDNGSIRLNTMQMTFALTNPLALNAGTYGINFRGTLAPGGVNAFAGWAPAADPYTGGSLQLNGIAVPEPDTLALLLLGIGSISVALRMTRRMN